VPISFDDIIDRIDKQDKTDEIEYTRKERQKLKIPSLRQMAKHNFSNIVEMLKNLVEENDEKDEKGDKKDKKDKRNGIMRQIFFIDYTLPEKDQRENVLNYKKMGTNTKISVATSKGDFSFFDISENGKLQRGNYENGFKFAKSMLVGLYLLSLNPEKMALKYSENNGRCCFCQLKLKDKKALAHGYGKICAKKLHLSW
jgi:hypothetical protein